MEFKYLLCMEYVTDRDIPNHFADGVDIRLCDMCDYTLSCSKEQLNELCDNFGITFI